MSEVQDPRDAEAQGIANYLLANPDFFDEFPELLMRLRVPHASGQAVSLVERQMQALRDKLEQVEQEKAELIAIARDNVAVGERIQDLTLALIGADTFDELIMALQDMLYDYFEVEAVELRLLCHAELEQMAADPAQKRIADIFHGGEPVSGRFAQAMMAVLFGPQAASVQSSALVPLHNSASYGILIIGSQNPERFTPDKGTLFLGYLAQVLNQCLRRLALPGA